MNISDIFIIHVSMVHTWCLHLVSRWIASLTLLDAFLLDLLGNYPDLWVLLDVSEASCPVTHQNCVGEGH